MKRREFIQRSAFAAAALAAQPAFAIAKKPKVIVIGAGLSGLAAAYELHQKNYDYIVLEGRNRIGGRVFSHVLDERENLVVELGAEWVGESHTRIRQLCEEMRLPLDNNQMDTHLIYANRYHRSGEWGYSEQWKTKFDQLKKGYNSLSVAEKNKLDQMDWWRFLNENGCDGFDLRIHELNDTTDFGETIRQISALAALSEYALSSVKNEMDFKIRGGNSMLAKKIAERIAMEKIILNCTVTKIVQDHSGVEVFCSNGQQFKADKLICTMPTFAMSRVEWSPLLPQEKRDAMHALQYARINKNPILFSTRFWKDENFDLLTDMPAHYFYHATKNQRSQKGALTSYTVGDKADVVGNQSDHERWSLVQLSLQAGFDSLGPIFEKQVNYNWGEDMFTKGAYAVYRPGQWTSLQKVLRKHFMHTHFAGEHLADWQGFMEGAINTGEEAAHALM
ncbi:MAG: FAD-dependent oxidoreductase [Chryseolinea sp.]